MPLLQFDSSTPFTGLGTWTFTVTQAGTYTTQCQANIMPGSQLDIQLQRTGSATTTVSNGGDTDNPAPPSQPAVGCSTSFLCAAADVITVTLTSSASIDAMPNAVKGYINLFRRGD